MVDQFFIFGIFVLFSLGHLGRISLLNQEVNFYVYEILSLIYFLFLILKNKLRPLLIFFSKNKLVLYAILFFLTTFLINSNRYQMKENIIAFLYLLRIIFYILFFIYVYFYFQNKKLNKELGKGINIFVYLTIIFSLIQYFFYPNLRNIIYLGWDPHWYRMLGLFFDSYLAGAIFSLITIFFFLKKKLLMSLIFFLFTILTFSRNCYLALFFTALFYFLQKRRFKECLLFIFFIFVLILIVPKPFGESVNLRRYFTIEARLKDYQIAFLIWKNRPYFGVGYNHIGSEKLKLEKTDNKFGYSHALRGFSSSYLIILVTGGIVGLFLFILGVRRLIFFNQFSYWGGLFLLLASFFDNVLFHPLIIFLYIFMALVSLPQPDRLRRLV